MAEQSIGHQPNLTADALMKSFEKHFGDRYDVFPTPPGSPSASDFFIRKSDFAAVGVSLKQEKSDTKIVYSGHLPAEPPFSWFVPYTMLLYGIIFFRTKPMMDEVTEFLESHQDFSSTRELP